MSAEIYVSTDIEADGPIPGPHSMVSFASAAFTADGRLVATISLNLDPLPEARGHPDTMAWWAERPEAWAAARADPQPPEVAMRRYEGWLGDLPGQPVCVGYPVGYDFIFLYWYLMKFLGRSPFGRMALDSRTYAMAALGRQYRECARENLPERWLPGRPHTHVALDDAIEQGEIFCAMLQELTAGHRRKGE